MTSLRDAAIDLHPPQNHFYPNSSLLGFGNWSSIDVNQTIALKRSDGSMPIFKSGESNIGVFAFGQNFEYYECWSPVRVGVINLAVLSGNNSEPF